MGNLIITGLVAGNGNGRPNVVELYAVEDDSANSYSIRFNELEEENFQFSIGCCSSQLGDRNTITQGEFYTITDNATAFKSYFGVDANFTSQNITDAFATAGFPFGEVGFFILNVGQSDAFGDNTTSWFYSDGWAYRKDGTTFDFNDGFVEDDWTFKAGSRIRYGWLFR